MVNVVLSRPSGFSNRLKVMLMNGCVMGSDRFFTIQRKKEAWLKSVPAAKDALPLYLPYYVSPDGQLPV